MFPLTSTHLQFICQASTPLCLETDSFRAGSNLRGALAQVMARAYCTGDTSTPAHTASCPICWLLAANEKPGQERRGYALVPPLPGNKASQQLETGERFEFGITLFGNAAKFLPYFVLAVPEMGRLGVGPGRGKFTLTSLWARNPLTGARECLMAEGERMVHTPTLALDHAQVRAHSEHALSSGTDSLVIRFQTPLRMIDRGELAKTPDFPVLFARLLKRLDDLAEQHSGGSRRSLEEVATLKDQAERVYLMETNTRWIDVWSGSSRRGVPSPMGGLVGRAVFKAPTQVWRSLFPWLLWGQLVQVGKDTVKGNGVLSITLLPHS